MASLPPPPVGAPSGSFAWVDWYRQLRDFLVGVGGTISWNSVDKSGASLTDIPTRAHNTLQTLQGGAAGEYYHLTAADYSAIGGIVTTLSGKQPNIQFKDEGTAIGTSGGATSVDFTGAGVTATFSSGTITINIPGGGGGGISDGDKGDIVVSGSGTVWAVDTGVIDTTKLGGDITSAGKALLDDADAAAQRTTLGAAAASHTHSPSDILTVKGTSFITIPWPGQNEWEEVVTATGVASGDQVFISIAPHSDSDENHEMALDIKAMAAEAGTNQITVRMGFGEVTSGVVRFNYRAN